MEDAADVPVTEQMAENFRSLTDAIARANADAKRTISEAVKAFEEAQKELVERLVSQPVVALPAAAFTARASSLGTAPSARTVTTSVLQRKSARSIILGLLADADDPVAGKVVEDAVVAGGWSKAASDKMKSKLKKSGLATGEKGAWTITAAGREALT